MHQILISYFFLFNVSILLNIFYTNRLKLQDNTIVYYSKRKIGSQGGLLADH